MKRTWYEDMGSAAGGDGKKARAGDGRRGQIIYLADRLIRRKGYNAFSYADIAGVMEIRNAAIHYYFPTKSELGQAVIEKELERLRQHRLRVEEGSGEEQFRSLVSVFYRNSQLNNICLMGSLLPDFTTFDPDMQKAVGRMCDIILEWMTGSLDKARKERKVRFEGEPSDRAALVVSTLLTALLLARARGESVFFQMVDRLLADLKVGWRVCNLPELEIPAGESPSFT